MTVIASGMGPACTAVDQPVSLLGRIASPKWVNLIQIGEVRSPQTSQVDILEVQKMAGSDLASHH
jgi:hypothetical protein